MATNILSFPSENIIIEKILDEAERLPEEDSINSFSIQKEILRKCKVDKLQELQYKKCLNFRAILPENVFCPLEKSQHWTLFDEKRSKLAMKKVKGKETKSVNFIESSNVQTWGSEAYKTAAFYLSQSHCPLIFNDNGKML